MTDLQSAFAALAGASSHQQHADEVQEGQHAVGAVESAALQARPTRARFIDNTAPYEGKKRLPIKKYLQKVKEQHKESGPRELMIQNVHPNTTKQELAEVLKQRIKQDFVLVERGNTKFDPTKRTREQRTYNHKLVFAVFEDEVPLELVPRLRGIQLNGRSIFIRRSDQQLPVEQTVFVRGIRGNCNIQDVVNRVNQFVQKHDKELHIDDIKMVYRERKLRGFIYLQFNKKVPKEVGDMVFMKAFEVNGDMIQLKKYVGQKKLSKQKIADNLGYKKTLRGKKVQPKSTLAASMMKKHERQE